MKIEFPKSESFRKKMIESFRSGVVERFGNADAVPIPPEDDLLQSSPNAHTDIWAILLDGVPAGAAVISKDDAAAKYSLDLLFIFKEFINKRIGSKTWQLIEAASPPVF